MATRVKQLIGLLLIIGVCSAEDETTETPGEAPTGGGGPCPEPTACLAETQKKLELTQPSDGRPSTEIDWESICSTQDEIKTSITECESKVETCDVESQVSYLNNLISRQRFELLAHCHEETIEGCDPQAISDCIQPIIQAFQADPTAACSSLDALGGTLESCQLLAAGCSVNPEMMAHVKELFASTNTTMVQSCGQMGNASMCMEQMAAVQACAASGDVPPPPEGCQKAQEMMLCFSTAVEGCDSPMIMQTVDQFKTAVCMMNPEAACPDTEFTFNGAPLDCGGGGPPADCTTVMEQFNTCVEPIRHLFEQAEDVSQFNCSSFGDVDPKSILDCVDPLFAQCPTELAEMKTKKKKVPTATLR